MKLNLFQKLVLIFWVPALIYILFMIFFPIKHIKYKPKTQINLPEEHKQLLSVVEEVEVLAKPIEIDLTMLKTNPFYKETPKLNILGNQSLPPLPPLSSLPLGNQSLAKTSNIPPPPPPPLPKTTLRLTSIIKTPEKSVCIINNKPYYVGSVVEGYKIYKIGEYYVELKGPKGRIKLEVGNTLAL